MKGPLSDLEVFENPTEKTRKNLKYKCCVNYQLMIKINFLVDTSHSSHHNQAIMFGLSVEFHSMLGMLYQKNRYIHIVEKEKRTN